VHEKLTIFPYGQYIVGNVCLLGLLKKLSGSRLKLGFARNLQKCNSHFMQQSCHGATYYARLILHRHGYDNVACKCVDTLVPNISVLGHFGPWKGKYVKYYPVVVVGLVG